jgi:hypothetical protein
LVFTGQLTAGHDPSAQIFRAVGVQISLKSFFKKNLPRQLLVDICRNELEINALEKKLVILWANKRHPTSTIVPDWNDSTS